MLPTKEPWKPERLHNNNNGHYKSLSLNGMEKKFRHMGSIRNEKKKKPLMHAFLSLFNNEYSSPSFL